MFRFSRTAVAGIFLLLAGTTGLAQNHVYYVAPDGSDTNPGTFDLPFKTIHKAVGQSSPNFIPGDTVYVRGGIYPCSTTVSLSKIGTSGLPYHLLAYPGERAVVDFILMPTTSTSRGFSLSGSYWYIKGFDILRARDNGMIVSGSNNIIEFCSFSENGDTGLQLGGGASNNRVINCDSYFNVDQPAQGNADGFSPKLDVGSGNSFYGCRAWQNSDDGWDGYLSTSNDVTTTLENCWCFMNGYLAAGSTSLGNGNGFKMGGSGTRLLMHNFVLINCLAFDNRVKGFDQNNNRGSMTLLNCTAYRNGTNYSVGSFLNYAAGKVLTISNSLALGAVGSVNDSAVQRTNSWLYPFPTPVNTHFQSVDTTGVRGPRKADGSLPDVTFMHLAPGSPFIDAGTDIGIPYNGTAPDLGAFETDGSVQVNDESPAIAARFHLLPNYPNPFNSSTIIAYSLPAAAEVTVRVFTLLGREVGRLSPGRQSPGIHRMTFDASGLASGVYLYRVSAGSSVETRRLVLIR